MRSVLLAGVLLICAVEGSQERGQQVFRSAVQTVFVDVSIMRGHTPVVDLKVTDFSLTDNRVQQQIEAVASSVIPLDVSLVIDATHTGVLYGTGANAGNRTDVQRSVRQMGASLRADDRLQAVTFAAEVVETRPRSSVGSALEPLSIRNSTEFTNRYAVTEALLATLTAPVALNRRHLIVLFALGSGKPTVAPLERVVRVARRADALLYAVLTPMHKEEITNRPLPFFPSEMVVRNAVTQAAEVTGGKAYSSGGDILDACAALAERGVAVFDYLQYHWGDG